MGFFDAFAFLGGIVIYPVAGFAISYLSWRYAFFIPAGLLTFWSVLFFMIVKDSPSDYGLSVEWKEEESQSSVNIKDYLDVLKNSAIILVSLSAICSQFVRWGLVNWVIKILTTSQDGGGFGIVLMLATIIASAMHWGGAVFSIGLGYMSDTVFKGSRWQTIAIGFIISGISLLAIYFWGYSFMEMTGGIFILALLLFLAGGCIQGVQAPLFNLPGDILGTRLGGTGVGIVNGWSYIGASFAGTTLGFIMDNFSLLSCVMLMSILSLIGAVIIFILRK